MPQDHEKYLNLGSIDWAFRFIAKHSDGDIFPRIPELQAIASDPAEYVEILSKTPLSNLKPKPYRRFDVPKSDLSTRKATQLHPQDTAILTGLIYQYGEPIENKRLPGNRVFSYRFDPNSERGLYGQGTRWNEFWNTAYLRSHAYQHIVYCDIADFYNQIYHHTVENQLDSCGLPKPAIDWIIQLVKSTTEGLSQGVPIGPHAVHLIAECTLIPIDEYLTASGVHFLRYSDDFLIFANTEIETIQATRLLNSTLDDQQRLTLQDHKTRRFTAEDFQEFSMQMIEDRPINDEEENMLYILYKYDTKNPYATFTYEKIATEDWEAFSKPIVTKIVNEYISQDEIDYIRLRWFFRRLAQVGHPGALDTIIENIDSLEPCLASVCAYIASIQAVPEDEWRTIGRNLLDLLENHSILDSEFARLSILSLFSTNRNINHFPKLAQRFNSADAATRREILLAALANGREHWLRARKGSFNSMDPWQRMAYVYCASILASDEKRYFLQRQRFSDPFDKALMKWSLNH